MTTAMTDTHTLIAGLHASSPQALPFDESVAARAFLLEREAGNVLIYSNGELSRDVPAFEALGGIARQYLNHWHESLFGGLPGSGIDAPLVRPSRTTSGGPRSGSHVRGTFSRRSTTSAPDLEVIPTPGHTPGATAYLWDTGEHRLLLTGDTLYLRDGEWRAAVLDSSDRASYIESLGFDARARVRCARAVGGERRQAVLHDARRG